MRFSQENVHSSRTEDYQSPPSQRTQESHRLIFPKLARILKRKQFKSIAEKNTRFVGRAIIILSRPAKTTKLGITASRQFGNAIKRNRFKRLVREAFRQNRYLLSPFEIVVLPKKGVSDYTLSSITRDLLEFSHAQSPATESR